MNDALQSQLAIILGKITDSVSQAGSFAISQLPDVVSQYVNYRIAISIIAIIFSIIVLVGIFKLFIVGVKHKTESYLDDTKFVTLLISGLSLIFWIVSVSISLPYIIMPLVAPKYMVIEALTQLMH